MTPGSDQRSRPLSACKLLEGDRKVEPSAAPLTTLRLNIPTMCKHDSSADRKAQSCAHPVTFHVPTLKLVKEGAIRPSVI
jgi:hypothetical protein